jgi:hypothetical protein
MFLVVSLCFTMTRNPPEYQANLRVGVVGMALATEETNRQEMRHVDATAF